jgi:hypothetical protein
MNRTQRMGENPQETRPVNIGELAGQLARLLRKSPTPFLSDKGQPFLRHERHRFHCPRNGILLEDARAFAIRKKFCNKYIQSPRY